MMDKVKHARKFAIDVHMGQERKFSDMPYVAHPMAVHGILSGYRDVSEDELAAAFLHDVLEDTDVPPDVLKREFGEDIFSIVEDLTIDKPESIDKTLYLKSEMLSMPDSSLRVKLADRFHNASDLHLAPDSFRERYAKSTEELIGYVRYHRSNLESIAYDLCRKILNVPALR